MRSQTRPFTIEIRKNRRLPSHGQTELGLVSVKAETLAATRQPRDAILEGQVFRPIVRSGRTSPF